MTRSLARRRPERPGVVTAVARGAVAGVIAAAATTLFQAAWTHAQLPPTNAIPAMPPPTEELANDIAVAVTGHELAKAETVPAGEIVHHVVGAGLGIAYALLARELPSVTAGRGIVYGLGVWATVEETGLALAGLKPPPWQVEAAEHVLAASSHLVFGMALDAAFRALSVRRP